MLGFSFYFLFWIFGGGSSQISFGERFCVVGRDRRFGQLVIFALDRWFLVKGYYSGEGQMEGFVIYFLGKIVNKR